MKINMLMSKLTVFFVIVLGFVFNTLATEPSISAIEKLKWIETASPESDAQKAIAQKDFRLRAVYGFTVIIPGVDQKDYDGVKQTYGIKPIEGTSDYNIDSEHATLNRLASEYASKYNSVILKHNEKKNVNSELR